MNISALFTSNNVFLLARIIAFLTALPVHELAHAYVSYKQGDPTAKNMGRLTLNPLKHLDLMGTIMLIVAGVGWAKPVPVNPNYYKNPKRGMAITALAGPVSNLILAYLNMVIYKLMMYLVLPANSSLLVIVITEIFLYLALINVSLAVFNLLPVPPLDGSRILSIVLPDKLYFQIQKYERFIFLGLMVLVYLGAFSGILSTMNKSVITALNWLTGYIDVIFRALA